MPEDWVAYHLTALTDVYSYPALYNRFRMIVNYFKGKVDGAAAVSLVTVPPTYQCLALLIVCISCKKIGFDGYTDQQSMRTDITVQLYQQLHFISGLFILIFSFCLILMMLTFQL